VRRAARAGRALSFGAALFAAPSPGAAQLLVTPPASPHVLTPGRSLAGNADASAIVTNPANLALLPAHELRWTLAAASSASSIVQRGHAFDLASPLLFGLSAGLRFEFVKPGNDNPLALGDYRWLTGAIAYGDERRGGLGLSLGRSYSDDARLAGHWHASAGLTAWPWQRVGLSIVAHNWNAAVNRSGARFDRLVDAGLAIRPFGTRALEVGLEGRYGDRFADTVPGKDRFSPRAVLGLDVPALGRLRADVQVDRPFTNGERSFVASAGLELVAGRLAAGGGAFGGSNAGAVGGYASVALRGFREPGLPRPAYAVRVRLETTPGVRGHTRLLRSLWHLADTPEVAAVALTLKTTPADSTAHVEEVADALALLRQRGKKVICHLEDAGSRALHACARADRIVINPAGNVGFSGLQTTYFYAGELAAKFGVRAEFVRIGEHKSAPEMFTESGPTPASDADHRDSLDQLDGIILGAIAEGRRMSVDELRARVAKGPFSAREAKEAGLVDGFAYDDELPGVVAEVVGRPVPLVKADDSPAFDDASPETLGPRRRVAVIYLEGDMIDGRSRIVPVIGSKFAGSYTLVEALQAAREDPLTRAVVLRVETPGGSSSSGEIIWREAAKLAKVKPLIVSMGTTAASAGYYVSSAGAYLFANRATVTGSIGIYYGKADAHELLDRLGLRAVTYKTTPRADGQSYFRPFTDDERQKIGEEIKQGYDQFVDRVARGRHMSPAEVDAVARGRVWMGQQAVEKRLVDRVGGLRQALDEARRRADLGPDAPLIELPSISRTLFQQALAIAGVPGLKAGAEGDAPDASSESPLPLPPALLDAARALTPFLYLGQGGAMMRLDVVPVGP
jgi:protease IV